MIADPTATLEGAGSLFHGRPIFLGFVPQICGDLIVPPGPALSSWRGADEGQA